MGDLRPLTLMERSLIVIFEWMKKLCVALQRQMFDEEIGDRYWKVV